jgi:hypothetical protein
MPSGSVMGENGNPASAAGVLAVGRSWMLHSSS